MKTCEKCGGVKFEIGEVSGYAGPICMCDIILPPLQGSFIPMPTMPLDAITVLRDDVAALKQELIELRLQIEKLQNAK